MNVLTTSVIMCKLEVPYVAMYQVGGGIWQEGQTQVLEDGWESTHREHDPGNDLKHPQVVFAIFGQATVSKLDYYVPENN